MGMPMGPAAPMMTDQNNAGRSRAAQAQYLRGVDQKYGAGVMVVMVLSEDRGGRRRRDGTGLR